MRLIDADALEEKIDKNGWCITEACDAIGFVTDAPTVDAIPVQYAHWEKKGSSIVCSRCKKGFTRWDDDGNQNETQFLYCPNCNAKID